MIDYRFSAEDPKWDFLVVSRYRDNLKAGQKPGGLAMITVHQGNASKEMEVEANKSLGRETQVYDLRGLNQVQRRDLEQAIVDPTVMKRLTDVEGRRKYQT